MFIETDTQALRFEQEITEITERQVSDLPVHGVSDSVQGQSKSKSKSKRFASRCSPK